MTYEIFYKHGVIKYFNYSEFLESNILAGMTVLFIVLSAIIGYLLGSLNCSLLISKVRNRDVRNEGSGNAGTTNVMRVFGKKAGIFTFIGDFIKTVIACYAGMALWGIIGAYIAGICCLLGHAFPVFFKFKGGKGVVCAAALCLITTWDVFLILVVVFVAVLLSTRMVSLASVMSVIVYPFLISVLPLHGPGPKVLFALLVAALVIFLHRKNLVRIFNHEENKIKLGKKKKVSEPEAPIQESGQPVKEEKEENEG